MGKLDKYLVAPEEKTIEVEHDGDTFIFRGKPSGATIEKAMLNPDQCAKRVSHYRATKNAKVKPEDVATVILISAFYVRDDGESTSEADFALLKETNFVLYGKFATAASQIAGFAEKSKDENGAESAVDPSVVTGLGNLPSGAPQGSGSSLSA